PPLLAGAAGELGPVQRQVPAQLVARGPRAEVHPVDQHRATAGAAEVARFPVAVQEARWGGGERSSQWRDVAAQGVDAGRNSTWCTFGEAQPALVGDLSH